MAYRTKKLEGGHKKGHSNMAHWTGTEEIKRDTSKGRRVQSKEICRQAEMEYGKFLELKAEAMDEAWNESYCRD